MSAERDTIFALASPPGRSAVAVIRLSGPRAAASVAQMRRRPLGEAGRLTPGWLWDGSGGHRLDYGMAVWFAAPATATGEETAEVHVHGSPAVIEAVLAALTALPGVRPAVAGEFTRRAFLAGKMDLSAVEGLADLIAADTERQRAQALVHLGGGLRRQIEAWHEELKQLQAAVEAALEFPDEDLDAALPAQTAATLTRLSDALQALQASLTAGQRIRDGAEVVLLGPPNAGKSSLLNALARDDRAIVTEEAGTTRDVLEVSLSLGGVPVRLLDTAGLRESSSAVEREGIRRARARAARADLVLQLSDCAAWADLGALAVAAPVVRVRTKIDSHPVASGEPAADVAVSAVTGEGLAALEAAITARLTGDLPPMEAVSLTRLRHAEALATALAHLQAAQVQPDGDLLAEDLRLAQGALARILGRTDPEDLLDRLFSSFCIGK